MVQRILLVTQLKTITFGQNCNEDGHGMDKRMIGRY